MSIYTGAKILKWHYRIQDIELLIPEEEPYKIPTDRIVSINILDDYETNVFPVFKVEMILESSIYYKIMKSKNDVQFHLRIQKYYNLNDSSTQSLARDVINDTFDLILDDDNSDLIASQRQLENKYDFKYIKQDDTNNPSKVDNDIEFYLFKSKTVKGLQKNINKIFTSCTISDVLSYLLSYADVKNILMSSPHNLTKYNSFIIPPLSCIKALRFIDTFYGIYKTGSMIYFGLDYSYILSYEGKCTAYKKNEIKNTAIIIPKQSGSHTTECCTLYKGVNSNTNYVVGDYRTISIRNDSISNDIISANSIKLVDNLSGNISYNSSSNNSETENSFKILENNTENPWLGDTYISQTKALDTVIEILLMDYDINMITPNKKFNLIFEDPNLTDKYNGVYLLTYASHTFIKDGSDFILTSIVRFKKTN